MWDGNTTSKTVSSWASVASGVQKGVVDEQQLVAQDGPGH